MRHRYENWVEGLNGDWLVSRQRFFGVPMPVWYPLDAAGEPVYDEPLLPDESRLPIDPSTDVPVGLRGRPARPARRLHRRPGHHRHLGDVVADPADRRPLGGRGSDLFDRVFPMDMRPQGHDIIRTWLFSTMVRSHYEFGVAAVVERRTVGLDPRPRPQEDVEVEGQRRHAARPVRDRTAPTPCATGRVCGRPGVDTAFSEDQMKVGRKLATKLLNVTKFVLDDRRGRRRGRRPMR